MERTEQIKAIKRLFQTEDGKFLLSYLATITEMSKTSFTVNDPYQTSFNEGKKAVFLNLLKVLDYDLEKDPHFTKQLSYKR